MNTHLHAFEFYKDAVEAFNKDLPNNALINHSRLEYQQGNDKVIFKAIPDMTRAHDLAGLQLRSVIYHYTPSLQIKEFIDSRIRFVPNKGER